MTTPADLGERALRRLGVEIVPVASRPTLATTVTVTAIAERALQALGATVTLANRPAFTTTIPAATLATGALIELGVIASDETPAATDQALALAKLQEVHDALVAQGAVAWASTAILQAAAEEYIKLTALWMASSFGKTGDPAQIAPLEARVKRVSLLAQSQALAEARVNAIHDALVGNAHVSWAVTAIPQAVSDDYVALTRFEMAPVFGVDLQAPPGLVQSLEARVRRFSLVQRAPDLATEAVTAVHADLAARGKVRWTALDIPLAAEQPYVLLAAFKLAPEFAVQPNPNDYTLAEKSIARLVALPTSGERVRADYF
jgi:hypothetical protein